MALRRPRLQRLAAGACAASAMALLAVALAACQDEPLFVSAPPSDDTEWAFLPPYEGEFRAQDLEIAALVQLTESGSPAHLIDASFKGELTVSPYPVMDPAGLMTACGLWLLSPCGGQRAEDPGRCAGLSVGRPVLARRGEDGVHRFG